MPRSFRAASILGPTPGNSVTGRDRSSVKVVRTGEPGLAPPGASPLEVGHAIGSQAHVRPYYPAYLGDELLLHPEALRELGEELRGCDVAEVQRAARLCRWPYLLRDRSQLPFATARALVRNYLSVFEPQDRTDVERRSHESLRPPDAAALREVLQRAHGEEDSALPDGRLRVPTDILE